VACAAPVIAAILLAFDSGGYYPTGWGSAALALLGVLCVASAGLAGGFGGPLGLAALGGWGALAAWQGASGLWALEPAAATVAMGQTLLYGAAFGLTLVGLRRSGWLPRLTEWLLAACAAVATAAVGARLLPDLLGGDEETRLSTPITYWNGLGALLAFATVLAVGVAGDPGRRLAWRSSAAALVPLFLLGLLMTYSRGGFIALIFGLGLLVALAPGRLETVGALLAALAVSIPLLAFARSEQGIAPYLGPLPPHEAEGRRVLAALLAAMLCAGALAFLGARAVRPLEHRARRAMGLAIAAVAIVVVGGALAANPPQGGPVTWVDRQWDAFRGLRGPTRTDDSIADALLVASGSGRWNHWIVAADEWKSAPLAGTGAGDFRFYWNERRDNTVYVINAHSLYLEVLAESGIIGLALLLVPPVAVLAAAGGVRLRRSDAALSRELMLAVAGGGAVALHLGADWDWQLPAVVLPAVVLGAGALKAASIVLGEDGRGARTAGLLVALSCVAAVLVLAGPVGSAFRFEDAKAAAARGDLGRALELVRDAARLDPASADAHRIEAFVLADLGRPRASDAAFAEALRRSPHEWSIYADWSARMYRRGQLRASRVLLARALELNPRAPRLRVLREEIGTAG